MKTAEEISVELSKLLNELRGAYSLLYQAYTHDPRELEQAMENCKKTELLLSCIEKDYLQWITTDEASAKLKNQYECYIQMGKYYVGEWHSLSDPLHMAEGEISVESSAAFYSEKSNPAIFNLTAKDSHDDVARPGII